MEPNSYISATASSEYREIDSMASDSTAAEQDRAAAEAMQSPAKHGGMGVNLPGLEGGTSLSHPKKASTSPLSSDHSPESSLASQDGLQHVDLEQAMEGLPPHIWPLITSISHYPKDQQGRMVQMLLDRCRTAWKERIDLWVRTHPIRSKVTSEHVPPITFRAGQFLWITRAERRR